MSTHKPISLQVVFRHLDVSQALEAKVREKIDKLGQFYPSIESCRVVIEQLHKHHQRGNHFRVLIDLKVPGQELVAGREPDQNPAYTDVYVALRDAFKAMRRQLEDLVHRQQGHTKHHIQV